MRFDHRISRPDYLSNQASIRRAVTVVTRSKATPSDTETRNQVAAATDPQSVESAVDLIDDFEAHLAGGAGDDAEGGFVVARVQIFGFRFHDVHDLLARHFADFLFVRLF